MAELAGTEIREGIRKQYSHPQPEREHPAIEVGRQTKRSIRPIPLGTENFKRLKNGNTKKFSDFRLARPKFCFRDQIW